MTFSRDCGDIQVRQRFRGAILVWSWLGYPLSRFVRHLPPRAAAWAWEHVVGTVRDACYEMDDGSDA